MERVQMRRRELLRTVGFVAGVTLPGEPAADSFDHPRSENQLDDRWFLDWLPPALVEAEGSYSFGATMAPVTGPVDALAETGRRHVHLLTDHAAVHIAVGVDSDVVREQVLRAGYERQSTGAIESYGRSHRHRHRVVVVDDSAAILGRGPSVDLVRDRVLAVADTDGIDDPDGSLARTLGHVEPADHLSVDINPATGIAGVGERITAADTRSQLRTVILPTPTADDRTVTSYLTDIGDIDGVLSTSMRRRGRALVREATVRTTTLQDRLEGRHVV